MDVKKAAGKLVRIFVNTMYFIGAAITLVLTIIFLFGSNEIVNSEAMLPRTWKEEAFVWLALGSVPMLLACAGVYSLYDIKNSLHKKRNFLLLFLPGFICSACMIFIIGLFTLGMINSFILH